LFAAGWSLLHRLAQSASEPNNAAQQQRFRQCIHDTIDRLVTVELQEAVQEAAAAGVQHQEHEQQQVLVFARQCVLQYVSEVPLPSRHYTGQQVLVEMDVVQLAQQKFDYAAAALRLAG
jgi:hypothetical protein